jgi:hypothetical protein
MSKPYGLVGWFETPAKLYHACEKLRDEGYKAFDAYTPFPVHGLEHAMGLKPSKMPWISLAGGVLGLSLCIWLAYFTQGLWYPHNVGGKPPFTFIVYVPIFFELTVLFAAFFTFFGVWAINQLPMFFHPVMQHPSFHRATDDRFFVSVEARDEKFDAAHTRALLEKLGAQEVSEVLP